MTDCEYCGSENGEVLMTIGWVCQECVEKIDILEAVQTWRKKFGREEQDPMDTARMIDCLLYAEDYNDLILLLQSEEHRSKRGLIFPFH